MYTISPNGATFLRFIFELFLSLVPTLRPSFYEEHHQSLHRLCCKLQRVLNPICLTRLFCFLFRFVSFCFSYSVVFNCLTYTIKVHNISDIYNLFAVYFQIFSWSCRNVQNLFDIYNLFREQFADAYIYRYLYTYIFDWCDAANIRNIPRKFAMNVSRRLDCLLYIYNTRPD